MTDRVNYLTVALEQDTRVDDVEGLVEAIRRLRGVLKVELGQPTDPGDWLAEQRVRHDLGQKIWQVLYPKKEGA